MGKILEFLGITGPHDAITYINFLLLAKLVINSNWVIKHQIKPGLKIK